MAENLAERFRRAREAFEAGVRMRCTPRDAAVRLRWEEADRKLAAKAHRADRGASISAPVEPALSEPWYRRGDMA